MLTEEERVSAQEFYEQQQEDDIFRINEIMLSTEQFNDKYRTADLVTRDEREYIRSVVAKDAD